MKMLRRNLEFIYMVQDRIFESGKVALEDNACQFSFEVGLSSRLPIEFTIWDQKDAILGPITLFLCNFLPFFIFFH